MSVFATLGSDGVYQLTQVGYIAVIAVIILALLLVCLIRKPDQKGVLGTRKLVFSAMAIALATVASMIKLFHLPMGGSITLFSMFFICLIGYWYGLLVGLMAAVAYGILQMVVDPYIISVPQMLCDYIFAFGALGLSGVFSNAKHGLVKGYLLGVVGRYVFSFLSGLIFFGQFAPEGMHPAVYSASYNGIYIFTEAILTIIIISIPAVSKALTNVKNLATQES